MAQGGRKGDSLLVTLDTAQPGLHRGKLTVRDRNGATPKTVRVLLRVLERKSPARRPRRRSRRRLSRRRTSTRSSCRRCKAGG